MLGMTSARSLSRSGVASPSACFVPALPLRKWSAFVLKRGPRLVFRPQPGVCREAQEKVVSAGRLRLHCVLRCRRVGRRRESRDAHEPRKGHAACSRQGFAAAALSSWRRRQRCGPAAALPSEVTCAGPLVSASPGKTFLFGSVALITAGEDRSGSCGIRESFRVGGGCLSPDWSTCPGPGSLHWRSAPSCPESPPRAGAVAHHGGA